MANGENLVSPSLVKNKKIQLSDNIVSKNTSIELRNILKKSC